MRVLPATIVTLCLALACTPAAPAQDQPAGAPTAQGDGPPPGAPAGTTGPTGPTGPTPPRHRRGSIPDTPADTGPSVPGTTALILSSGRAAAPAAAPQWVKTLIWTANRLIGLPYRYGGGHASFSDSAYDCSGSVSYALHAAGLLDMTEDSTALERWGRAGPGRWLTVYATRGHAWMTVAGIRLDTSAVNDPGGLDGPRWRPGLEPLRRFHARRPAAVP